MRRLLITPPAQVLKMPFLFLAMLIILNVTGCSQGGSSSTAERLETVAYAYSMLAPGQNGSTIIYARILLDAQNQACPILTGSDGSTLTTFLRPMYPDRVNSSASFPVTVCEAVMAEGVSYRSFNPTLNINAVTLAASVVQVYGDSGCEAADCSGLTPSSQFQALANLGAKQSPNLILHMGDYNYRGTAGAITGITYAYDAGDDGYGGNTCGLLDTYYSQNAENSPRPDSWPNWQADFSMLQKTFYRKPPGYLHAETTNSAVAQVRGGSILWARAHPYLKRVKLKCNARTRVI